VNGVVELTASATNDPTSWTWDPGGGTVTQSSTGPNSSDRTIQFNLDGDKTIKVFASNAAGDSVEKVIVVNVNVIDLPDVTITNLTNNAGTISASHLGMVHRWSPTTGQQQRKRDPERCVEWHVRHSGRSNERRRHRFRRGRHHGWRHRWSASDH
jgi:PKD repeat protein